MKVSSVRAKLASVCGRPASATDCKGFSLVSAPAPFSLTLCNGNTISSKISGNGCCYEVRLKSYLRDGLITSVQPARQEILQKTAL